MSSDDLHKSRPEQLLRRVFIIDGEANPEDGDKIRVLSTGGTFTPSGFQNDAVVTTLSVDGKATAIPGTALSGRNSISIFNKSATDTLYIGKDATVTADNTPTGGWEIGPRETLNETVSDAVGYFGITTGATITVKVRELS